MEKFKFLFKNQISRIPKNSGVYCFKEGAKPLYIGKAANIKERVKNHFQQPGYRDYLFLDKTRKIGFINTDSEIEALILEANLIKKYQPKYNVIWRDDKNYFFVAVTKEDFPRIFITHQVSNFEFRISNFEYVGPFVDGKALKQTLKVLRRVFPYRSCRVIPKRPCLWYHLNRCPAPCLLKSGFIREIPKDSLKTKRISQRDAKNLIKILKEEKNPVLKELKREMKKAAKNRDFEEAAKIRDQIMALERVMEHAKIFEPKIEKLNWPEIENKLKEILKIKNKISRIEAYDVSNIVGKAATGSMVAFVNGIPDKNFYRKFKIKISGKPDDIAMLKEVLKRRLRHLEWGLPDLILIDGGKSQLNAASRIVRSNLTKIKVVALAKRKNELYIKNRKKPILLKSLPREIFNLILQARDEAHRFARKYHLKLREKTLLSEN